LRKKYQFNQLIYNNSYFGTAPAMDWAKEKMSMIIIESQAEIRLTQTLESLKNNPGNKRCLWLKLSSISTLSAEGQKAVVADLARFITRDDCHLFQLFDKDIAIIGNGLTQELQQQVHDAVSRTLAQSLPEELVSLYELGLHWGRVALLVEDALQQKRHLAVKQQQIALQRQRQEILNMSFDETILRKMRTQRANRRQLEVMVVEDDAFSRQMVCNSLRKLYPVSAMPDGKSALQSYVLKAPDVLFLDINLPDVNGHDLLKKLLQIDPDAHIIMLSGNGDKENVMRAIKSGAKGFVGKPFTKEKLIQYIERHAGVKQPA